MFKTTCPKCGAKGQLEVVDGKFYASGMKLHPNGFSFAEAKEVQTDSEIVHCKACNEQFSLADVTE
jgi:hypothetical protein